MIADDRQPAARRQPTVALVDFTHLLEDFLDNIGVSFEAYRDMTGSWVFGYIRALQRAGIRSVLFAFSGRVEAPWRFTHVPSGGQVCVLPSPRTYRAIRRRLGNPYAATVQKAFSNHEMGRMQQHMYQLLWDAAPYLMTPLRAFARELRRERCDVILCQEYETPRFDACVLLGRLLRMPVYGVFQGGYWQFSHFERPLRPISLRASAGLIIGSREEADRVRTKYALADNKVARIFNPVDVTRWYPLDRSEVRQSLDIPLTAEIVVWHGRVEIGKKGLDVLLSAWKLLRRSRQGRDLRLILIGSGTDRDRLRDQIAAMPKSGVLWVNEFVSDPAVMQRYLSAADVYAFPSRFEGFPVAPVEAMACGLPIVAAMAQGVPDILEDGELSGGVMVPGNDAVALAAALGRLLDDSELRLEMGRRARRRVEGSFSLDAVGAQLRTFMYRD